VAAIGQTPCAARRGGVRAPPMIARCVPSGSERACRAAVRAPRQHGRHRTHPHNACSASRLLALADPQGAALREYLKACLPPK
jgi:hypothetical protein